jgi:hypothetical protein
VPRVVDTHQLRDSATGRVIDDVAGTKPNRIETRAMSAACWRTVMFAVVRSEAPVPR